MLPKNTVNTQVKNQNMLHHLKPMLVALLLCGFNYKFYKLNFTVTVLSRIYCIVLVVIVLYSTITCCETDNISQTWSLTEYAASVFIILLFRNKIDISFERLAYIDSCLRVKLKHYSHTNNKIYMFVFIVWLVRVVYTTFYCLTLVCYNDFTLYLISQCSLLALDLNRVWRFIVFDVIRYRLKLLRVRLEEMPQTNVYFHVTNQKTVKEKKIRFCLALYKNIAEIFELISPELFASLFVSIICSLPKLIINVYHILLIMESHKEYLALGFIAVHVGQIFIFLFSPCLVVELYSVEVENIRLLLINKLIEETDPTVKEDIELFLQYTQIRPFKHKIWRIIPINLTLPLEIISLCTTYVIVLINFTHLY